MGFGYWRFFSKNEIYKALVYRLKVASIWNKVALGIVCLGIGVVLFARTVALPASRAVKAEYFLWHANALAEEGKNEAAARAYRQALQNGGKDNARLLKALAKFLSRTKSPELMALLERLAVREPENYSLRYRQVELAMEAGRPLVAAQILKRIPESQRGDPRYQEVAALLAFERHDYDQAARLRREALEKTRSELRSARLVQGRREADARGTDPARRAAARRELAEIAAGTGEPAREALRSLVDLALADGKGDEARDLAARLADGTEATVPDQLLYLRVAAPSRPEEAPKIVRALQARAEEKGSEAIEAATLGLMDQGQLAAAEAWLVALPPALAETDEARRSRLLVRVIGGKWDEVFDQLEKGEGGYPVPVETARKVRHAFEEHDRDDARAERTWLQAVYMPEPEATTLNVLRLLASGKGWGRAEMMCLRRWTESYPDDLLAWRGRAKYETREGNLGGVCAALEAVRRIDALDVETNSRWVWASLLLRRDQAEGLLETAQAAYDVANPANPEVAFPYALALLAAKQNAPAAAVIERVSPADRASPRWAMFTGAVLTANRRPAEALPYFEAANPDALTFPEEEVFLQKWNDLAHGGADVEVEIAGMLARREASTRNAEAMQKALIEELAKRRRESAAVRARLRQDLEGSQAQRNQADAAKILASLREQVNRRRKTEKELRALLDSIRADATAEN